MKCLRFKLRASMLIESLIATAIVAIVLSIGLTVIFGSVWNSGSFQEELAYRKIMSIEAEYRTGQSQETYWELDQMKIQASTRLRATHLQEVELEAKDASNKILVIHTFLMVLP